jgi:hypothetical protein
MRCVLSVVVAAELALAYPALANPCNGVERILPDGGNPGLRRAIATQVSKDDVRVLEVLRDGRWAVYLVDPSDAEPFFAFFSGDPATSHYVTLWGGFATESEEKEIQRWVDKNAPGIPHRLSQCFAWRATHGSK